MSIAAGVHTCISSYLLSVGNSSNKDVAERAVNLGYIFGLLVHAYVHASSSLLLVPKLVRLKIALSSSYPPVLYRNG